MFLKIVKNFFLTNFVKDVGLLLTGSSAAQVIALLFAPILTRLYEPSHFAIYALFMAFLNSLSPGISGRYEIAIAIAPSHKESISLTNVAILVTTGLSGFAFLVFLFFDAQIHSILNSDTLGNWFYVVPVALFLIGVNEIMKRYSNSQKHYKAISYISFLQTTMATFGACIFSLIGLTEVGLLLSFLLAIVFSTFFYFYHYRNDFSFSGLKISGSQYQLAVKYRQFPLLNAPASLLNGVTLALPVFFLARDYPQAIVGYYALIIRVAAAPLSLISGAVSLVHLRAIADMTQSSSRVFGYMAKLTFFLSMFAGIPGVFLFITGPDLFALIFGETWRPAGEILRIIIPAIVVQFVVSTLSPVFSSTGNSHLAAGWRVLGFIVVMSVFLYFSGNVDVLDLFYVIAVTDIALYSLYFF